jgi:hypothetical protein
MCNYLQYFHSCGKDASARFRIGICIDVADLTLCRDRDRVIVLGSSCTSCYRNEPRRHSGPVKSTPPPSPDLGGEEVVWVMESKHSLFLQQEGFVCVDPWARDRAKRALRVMSATEREPIEIDGDEEVEETPTMETSDEDPFGPDGMRPEEERRKWSLKRFLSHNSKSSETSLCCEHAERQLEGLVFEGRIIDDRCESTV